MVYQYTWRLNVDLKAQYEQRGSKIWYSTLFVVFRQKVMNSNKYIPGAQKSNGRIV